MTEPLPLDAGGRVKIVRGSVTAEEAAAVVLALEQLRSQRRQHHPNVTEPAGWVRAARLEAIGAAWVATRTDLRRPL